MYILQKGLTKYFREISINNKVILVDNACRSMLFNSKDEVDKFRIVLLENYNYKFNVIEI